MGLTGKSTTYITQAGDTFDMIALDCYNEETKAGVLVEANPDWADTLIFDAGVNLVVPILEEEQPISLPPWKRG